MVHEKLAVLLIGFFAIIITASILASTVPGGRRIGWLGIMDNAEQNSCSGDLKITSKQIEGGCGLQADLDMKNCQGKKWYVIEGNSCPGNYVCTGNINDPISKWKCTWETERGAHTFSLCADSDIKASSTVSC